MEQHDITVDMMVDFIVAFFSRIEVRHAMLRAAYAKFPNGTSAQHFGGWLSDNMP